MMDAGGLSEELAEMVAEWFSPISIQTFLGDGESLTEQAGREWMAGAGKRWRPMLAASVYVALTEDSPAPIASSAVAVECFHKASLIHDDIEDQDEERYGQPTMHTQYGVPLAINIGDWLIGEGYRLLADAPFPAAIRAELVRTAARGHGTLCLGQGCELAVTGRHGNLSPDEVLRMYEQKTSSAFEVAVQTGAVAAGADAQIRAQLSVVTRLLGMVYQILDDRDDFYAMQGRTSDLLSMRPTIYLAEAEMDPALRPRIRALRVEDTLAGRISLLEAVAESEIPQRVQHRLDELSKTLREVVAAIPHNRLRCLISSVMYRCL